MEDQSSNSAQPSSIPGVPNENTTIITASQPEKPGRKFPINIILIILLIVAAGIVAFLLFFKPKVKPAIVKTVVSIPHVTTLPTKAATTSLKWYKNDQWNFSFQYPENPYRMVTENTINNIFSLTVDDRKDITEPIQNEFSLTVSLNEEVKKQFIANYESASEIEDFSVEFIKPSPASTNQSPAPILPTAKNIAKKTMTVAGVPAYSYIHLPAMEIPNVYQYIVFFDKDNTFYVFSFNSVGDGEYLKAHLAEFGQILSSFKFTESQAIPSWKTYTSDIFHISLQYPPEYEVIEEDTTHVTIGRKEFGFDIKLSKNSKYRDYKDFETCTEAWKKISADPYAERVLCLEDGIYNTKFPPISTIFVDNKEADSYFMNATGLGATWREIQLKGYPLEISPSAYNTKDDDEKFEKILKTVRISYPVPTQ